MKNGIKLLLLLLISSTQLFGQSEDVGIWTSLGAEKKLGKWNLGAETEFRTLGIFNDFDRWKIGLTGEYQILKPITIGAGYEFIYLNDLEYSDYQPRHRFNLIIQGKKKLGDFTFILKEKIQGTAKDVSDRVKNNGNIDNYKVNPEYTWRNKLLIEYNIPHFKVNPAISAESFYSLNNPDLNSFEQFRYTLSLQYKLSKHHKFEIFGMYSTKTTSDDAAQRYVLGIGYKYNIK